MRRHVAQFCRQALAEAQGCACRGGSTSGRSELTSWASSAGRQRWLSESAHAATLAAGGSGAAAASAAAAAVGGRRGPPSGLRRLKLMLQNYKQLSKMRLSLLVVSTAAAGYAAGSKERIDWAGLGWTCLGTMMASSSANALNQVYERVNDGLMKRTMNRPLPTGRMSVRHALAFAALAGAGGVWLLADKVRGHRLAGRCRCRHRSIPGLAWFGPSECAAIVVLLPACSRTCPDPPACPPSCLFADQPDHRSAGGGQHRAVRRRVHSSEADQHRQHLGGGHRGRGAAPHGLGGSHWRAGCRCSHPWRRALLLADASLHGAGLDVQGGLCRCVQWASRLPGIIDE